MNPPSVDVKDLLESAGLGMFGATSGWAIYIGTEPDQPDTTVTIYDITGAEPDYAAGVYYPAIQVRVRGAPYKYLEAYEQAVRIRDLLLTVNRTVIGNSVYSVWIEGDLAHLDTDESQRPIFVATYRLMRSDA